MATTKNKSNLKSVLHKMRMVQIPENALIHGVVKALDGRESFKDADTNLNERIYTGDVFEAILGENAQFEEGHLMRLSKKTEDQLEELAKICGNFEYVQVTTI
jgi:hypothetical protein